MAAAPPSLTEIVGLATLLVLPAQAIRPHGGDVLRPRAVGDVLVPPQHRH